MKLAEWLRAFDTEAWENYRYITMRASVDPVFRKKTYLNNRYVKRRDDLGSRFSWSETPQGFRYWCQKSAKLVNFMSEVNQKKVGTVPIPVEYLKDPHLHKNIIGDVTIICSDNNQFVSGRFGTYRITYPAAKEWDWLETMAHTFYTLQELALLKPVPTIKCQRAYDGWRERLVSTKTDLERRMARTLRDTMTATCFGEIRYADRRCKDITDEELKELRHWNLIGGRDYGAEVIEASKALHWREVAKLIPLFDREWYEDFGGTKWANIAKRTLSWSKLTPACFCDSVFGLVHNNGVAFNKQFMVHVDDSWEFERFLDLRQATSILESPKTKSVCYWLDTDVYYLLVDAVELGMVDLAYYKNEDILHGFVPAGKLKLRTIDWKGGTLGLKEF